MAVKVSGTPPHRNRESKKANSGYGLRAQSFDLLPGESLQEFEAFAASIKEDLAPSDRMERHYVESIVIAMWREMRIDQLEAEVLSDMTGNGKDQSYGPALANHAKHRTSLNTVLRLRSQAQSDLQRAIESLDTYRKNRRELAKLSVHEPVRGTQAQRPSGVTIH